MTRDVASSYAYGHKWRGESSSRKKVKRDPREDWRKFGCDRRFDRS